MKKGALILPLVWFLTTCSPRIYTSPVESPDKTRLSEVSQKPGWVVTKPIENGYYTGLGSAKTNQPDYHRLAKQKALEDMMTEISVTVNARSFLYQAEFGEHFLEIYEGFIKTTSLEELSEFELLNDWSDGNEYWVVYRLSKSRHDALKEKKKAVALAMAIEHLKNARTDERQGMFLTAIHNYLESVDALKRYLNEPLQVKIDAEEQLIIPYCINAIRKILNDLKIGEEQIQFNPLKRLPAPVTLYCRGLVAEGFSLTGIDRQLTTNQNGQIFVKMDAVTDRSLLTLTVSKDVLGSFEKNNLVLHELINSFNLPKFNIPVSILALTIHIDGEEYNLGNTGHKPSIKPALVNFLSAYGFIFNENPQSSDFKLTYKVTTRQGQETNGLYVSWADVEIYFYNSSDALIYSDQLLGVKGIHSSYRTAGARAIENITPLLKEKIVQPFVKNVF